MTSHNPRLCAPRPAGRRYNLPMPICTEGKGRPSMRTLLLSLLALSALTGCASGLYLGPGLSTCGGSGSAAEFASGACRSGAEYDVARKKAMRSLAESSARENKANHRQHGH